MVHGLAGQGHDSGRRRYVEEFRPKGPLDVIGQIGGNTGLPEGSRYSFAAWRFSTIRLTENNLHIISYLPDHSGPFEAAIDIGCSGKHLVAAMESCGGFKAVDSILQTEDCGVRTNQRAV